MLAKEGRRQKTNKTRANKILTSKYLNSIQFSRSREHELTGLVKDGTFLPIPRANISESTKVFGSRFIDPLNKAVQGLRIKSLLVVQSNNDVGATTISKKAPTAHWFSQRLVIFSAVYIPHMKSFTQDIS